MKTLCKGTAWAVQHHSGRICLGAESTPQLYVSLKRAREFSEALKPHIGRCRAIRVSYEIKSAK